MQLTCPECGAPVAAENINIQQMVAVCPVCDTVFQFEAPEAKAKRRKIKKPQHLRLRDGETLHMAFRTNFRLDQSEAFISSLIMGVVTAGVSSILTGEYLAGELPILLPLIFGLIAAGLLYNVALIAYNATHIEMDDEKITISRQPLPGLIQPTVVNLNGVVSFRCEETPESIKNGYDTPRYRVWAETADGTRRMIVNDVVEDYGYYIAQQLESRLHHMDADYDASRLEDNAVIDDADVDMIIPPSQQINRQS